MSTTASSGFQVSTQPVTRTQIVRFAGVGGDFNPMHHDEPFATAAGQPSVFAMGQLTAALVADAISAELGTAAVTGYGIRFKDKVWPGDRLVITATPDPADANRNDLVVTVESDGRTVASGWVATTG